MDINMSIVDKNKEDLELDSIFNRHLTSDTILNKIEVSFNGNISFMQRS